MNPAIQELYQEAVGRDWAYDFDPAVAERFAELIIQKCCQMTLDLEIKYPANLTVREIKRHFGFEP
jgi:hypothetical protein